MTKVKIWHLPKLKKGEKFLICSRDFEKEASGAQFATAFKNEPILITNIDIEYIDVKIREIK